MHPQRRCPWRQSCTSTSCACGRDCRRDVTFICMSQQCWNFYDAFCMPLRVLCAEWACQEHMTLHGHHALLDAGPHAQHIRATKVTASALASAQGQRSINSKPLGTQKVCSSSAGAGAKVDANSLPDKVAKCPQAFRFSLPFAPREPLLQALNVIEAPTAPFDAAAHRTPGILACRELPGRNAKTITLLPS